MIGSMNTPPSTAREALTLGGRFHYWTGQTGDRYIFSVYRAGACPPLPGAVYVIAGKSHGGDLFPVAIGRFAAIWEDANRQALKLLNNTGGDEVHVHLLAKDDETAEQIVCDLRPHLDGAPRLCAIESLAPNEAASRNRSFCESQSDLSGLHGSERAA